MEYAGRCDVALQVHSRRNGASLRRLDEAGIAE